MSASTPNTEPDAPLGRGEPGLGGELVVAVGLVRNDGGQVLIARRPPGVHLAGFWEFPGGKVERGETVREALRRELQEELDILVERASPLIQVRHQYPERRVRLHVMTVESFKGNPRGLMGQYWQWVEPDALPAIHFPSANRSIVTAALLPDRYAILDSLSNDEEVLSDLLTKLAVDGHQLIQLRAKGLATATRYRSFAARAIEFCRKRGILLLLNSEPGLVAELDADGVHLNAARLMAARRRPLSEGCWVSASCHNLEELRQAQRIQVDFAVLSPVSRTVSHLNSAPLGWDAFTRLVEHVNFPVYALGGLSANDIPAAREAGAQGIAAIRAFR